ncbi:MAG: cob(I)yrinic acid a,c-diamide adenosyltransferase [Defluviitaleaceae bacterium]|nr:cob(I)yrinic acid a,c-diamide adenosyltransferase [Defluviitaleaceae bacterium]
MNIYTRTGDSGQTSLFGGTRTGKDSLNVWAYGTIDEVNSTLGLVRSLLKNEQTRDTILKIQKKLFVVGAQLASDEKGTSLLKEKIEQKDIDELEAIIDNFIKDFGEIKDFVIPGESQPSAALHMARSTVRRAERHVYSLSKEGFVCPLLLKYVNRLSDAFFALASEVIYTELITTIKNKLEDKMDSEKDTLVWENMTHAALEEAKKLGVHVSVAVADINGNLLHFTRSRNAILPSIAIAENKAYSAATMKMTTEELGNLSAPSKPLFGINTVNPKLVIFGGGLPLRKNGEICGAVGVSGASVADDIRIAQRALEAFEASI